MPCRLAQRMTLSELEWPFHASRAISAVAELVFRKGVEIVGWRVSRRCHSNGPLRRGRRRRVWSAGARCIAGGVAGWRDNVMTSNV